MPGYGQFCPVAKSMEVLDERWTMLVVRELLCGSHHFNELRRGVPKMSSALLATRLRSLVRAGLVVRTAQGATVRYDLTPGGRALEPVVKALGEWGAVWRSRLGDEDLDPHLLMWDVHRNLDLAAMPAGRVVLGFRFPEVEAATRDWYVVVEDKAHVDLCDFDPGYDVSVTVTASLRTLTDVWRGAVSWTQATRAGLLRVDGARDLRRGLPAWLKLSQFAPAARRAGAAAADSAPAAALVPSG